MSLKEYLIQARTEKARIASLYWESTIEEDRERYQSLYCTALTIVQDLEFRLDCIVLGFIR